MKNDIVAVRNLLIAALEGLQDHEHPLDVDRALAAAKIGQVLVDSAKAETKHVEITGALRGSGFFPDLEPPRPLPRTNGQHYIENASQ